MSLLHCTCGSEWFALQDGVVAHGRTVAAISVNQSGEVVAWSGVLACVECGATMGLPKLQAEQEETPIRLVQ